MPDVPEPTSPALTKNLYVRAADIAEKAMEMLQKDTSRVRYHLPDPTPHDVPDEWFRGPF
jgi:pyruvate dehydrogenase E1 component beta subunit